MAFTACIWVCTQEISFKPPFNWIWNSVSLNLKCPKVSFRGRTVHINSFRFGGKKKSVFLSRKWTYLWQLGFSLLGCSHYQSLTAFHVVQCFFTLFRFTGCFSWFLWDSRSHVTENGFCVTTPLGATYFLRNPRSALWAIFTRWMGNIFMYLQFGRPNTVVIKRQWSKVHHRVNDTIFMERNILHKYKNKFIIEY